MELGTLEAAPGVEVGAETPGALLDGLGVLPDTAGTLGVPADEAGVLREATGVLALTAGADGEAGLPGVPAAGVDGLEALLPEA